MGQHQHQAKKTFEANNLEKSGKVSSDMQSAIVPTS